MCDEAGLRQEADREETAELLEKLGYIDCAGCGGMFEPEDMVKSPLGNHYNCKGCANEEALDHEFASAEEEAELIKHNNEQAR